ncbi:DUF2958 domain-containing protein [Virgibacillus sp. DJP39]|uniref:DUF2958 domain-containing protein n=1 Tax=Virgibacillus sp. DJP39 TaxID=3409790 RepID=UPI003BB5FF82
MELMTKELESQFVVIGETEDTPMEEKKVIAKFFCPSMTWYAIEYDPTDRIFFGYVRNEGNPQMSEWGYFSLDELEGIQKNQPSPFFMMERDLYFSPKIVKEIKEILLH